MIDSNALKDMITGYAVGVINVATLSNFHDGSPGGGNKYGEIGNFVDEILNDYNPELMLTLMIRIKNDPGTVTRCSNFIDTYGKQLQELIDTGKCSCWASHGVDYAITRLGADKTFWGRRSGVMFWEHRSDSDVTCWEHSCGDIGTVLIEAAGRGDVTVRVTPEEGSVANATDIHFAEY